MTSRLSTHIEVDLVQSPKQKQNKNKMFVLLYDALLSLSLSPGHTRIVLVNSRDYKTVSENFLILLLSLFSSLTNL